MNKAVLHKAVDLLSRREHGEQELYQKLKLREFLDEDIAIVICYLKEKDYLSEQRYAESVLRARVNKGYGWRYIKSELSQKGVNDTLINELRNNEEIDWYLQAELAYNKRFSNKCIADQKDKAKRIRFLQYRGFSYDEIMSAIEAES